MIAGGLGQYPGRPDRQTRTAGRRAVDPAGRPRPVDRPGRRRCVVDGHGCQCRRPGFRLGAARQPGNRTPLPGSHRPLLAAGRSQPGLSIHDVGAGGMSNALPELIHGSNRGGVIDLRAVPLEESGMSPMQIWCNEAQERYVLAIHPDSLGCLRRAVRARALPVAVRAPPPPNNNCACATTAGRRRRGHVAGSAAGKNRRA